MLRESTEHPIFITLPLLSYLGWLFYQHMIDPLYWSYLDMVNFWIHEFGHIFFMFTQNEFIIAAGGTIMQVMVPILIMIGFLGQRDWFGIVFCLGWLGVNFFYIATYAGDAIRLDLPLFGLFGEDSIHDWNYMFFELGVLDYTDSIAFGFKIIAIICMLVCLGYGSLLVVNRIRE